MGEESMTPQEFIAAAPDAVVQALAEWHPHSEDDSEDALRSRAARLAIERGHRPEISRAWGLAAGRLSFFNSRDPWQLELWVAAARRDWGEAYAEGYRAGALSRR